MSKANLSVVHAYSPSLENFIRVNNNHGLKNIHNISKTCPYFFGDDAAKLGRYLCNTKGSGHRSTHQADDVAYGIVQAAKLNTK